MIPFSADCGSGSRSMAHHWRHCLGSGHAQLALRADWQRQLARCRHELGIEHVRFHGILGDDLGTLVTVQERPLLSPHNADLIMEFLAGIGMSPLLELSFMPTALASGSTTVFHYAGNVTPPREPGRWGGLIRSLVAHWHDRFGTDILRSWLFEVWNEPNLPSFWSGDQAAYWDLYARTATAVKEVDAALRVGGPATAKGEWLPEFLAFCDVRGLPCDFVSTHLYPTDAAGGGDTTAQLAGSARSVMRDRLTAWRSLVHGRPLLLTEWNITSNPRDPRHDQPIAAAYLIKAALEMAGSLDGSSWWTFSDIFEENYFPSQPFHGGFGLLNLHGIPKPSYRAMEMLAALGNRLLPITGSHPTVDCWAIAGPRGIDVLVTNLVLPRQPGGAEAVRVRLLQSLRPERVRLRRIDDEHANPRRAWEEMGSPGHLRQHDIDRLEECSLLRDEPVEWRYADGAIELDLTIPVNGVAWVHCHGATTTGDATTDAVSVMTTGVPTVGRTIPSSTDSGASGLEQLQRESFTFFSHHVDPATGLARDSSEPGSPASIAATGMALACYPVAVERGWLPHREAARLTFAALSTLLRAPQGPGIDAAGHRGFFYHFLDPASIRRHGDAELSTIDSSLLFAGALMAASYFAHGSAIDRDIGAAATEMLERPDWNWALAGGKTLSHGWDPLTGFLPYRWEGYAESLLMYLLALGSPRNPLAPAAYHAATAAYAWRRCYDIEYLYAGPLFIHQLSHCWIDLRGIRDAPMREHDSDYFENSRLATLVQQRYAADNPMCYRGYDRTCWGFTACNGPGPAEMVIDGISRSFFGYEARGAPFGPDDGTIAPWAVAASLPFAPAEVLPTLRHFEDRELRRPAQHGFFSTFNPTFPDGPAGWTCPWHYGLNQGPIVLMIDNHLRGLPWELMRRCPQLVSGLRQAGFSGGWIGTAQPKPE